MREKYVDKLYIGEPIYNTNIYNILSKTEGVVDVKRVIVENKNSNNSGGNYSSISLFFEDIISQDQTFYKAPKNVIFELRNPDQDIKGKAV